MSHKIGLVYLNRNAEGSEPVTRFVQSYKKFSPGIAHEFITIYKGFLNDELSAAESMMDGVAHAHRAIRVDDAMTDIDSYLVAAKTHADIDAFCFLNTFSEINCNDWLLHLTNALLKKNAGIVGASASYESLLNSNKLIDKVLWFCDRSRLPYDESFHSQYRFYIDAEKPHWVKGARVGAAKSTADESITQPPDLTFLEAFDAEFEDYWDTITAVGSGNRSYCQDVPAFPNPHIRTNAFMIRREHLLPFCHRRSLMTKIESYWFESGWCGLTRTILNQGLSALVVNAEGESFELEDWPKSRTFRTGGQQELMVHDNQTRKFDSSASLQQKLMAHMSWGNTSTYPSPPVSTLGVPFLASNLASFKKSAGERLDAETDGGQPRLSEQLKLIRPLLNVKLATPTIVASFYFLPGASCSQRFTSPRPNMRAVSLQMVTWGQRPSACLINWKLNSLSGASSGIVSEGQIRAEELYDWVIIVFPIQEADRSKVEAEQIVESYSEFELSFEVPADALVEIPAGLPLFQALDSYDNALIVPTGGTHADQGVLGLTARFNELTSEATSSAVLSPVSVIGSTEFGHQRVRHLYALLLGRAPDSEGAQFYGEWCNSTSGYLRAWKQIGLSAESKNKPDFASRMLNTLLFTLFSDTTTVTRKQKQSLPFLPEPINEAFVGFFTPEADVAALGVWVSARVTVPMIARPGELIRIQGSYFPELIARQTGSGESKLSFFVDGEQLHSTTLAAHGDFDIAFPGPSFCCSERASLVIQCSKTFVPNHIDSSADSRKLSWRMKSLTVGGAALIYCTHPDLFFPAGESIAALDEIVARETTLNKPYAGFFQPESDLSKCGVWVSSKLVLPVQSTPGKTITVRGTYFPDLIEKQAGNGESILKFSLDGKEIHSAVLSADGDFTIDFVVPASDRHADANLTIECNNIFIPKSIGASIDSRRLSWRMKSLSANDIWIFDCATHIPEALSKIWYSDSPPAAPHAEPAQTTTVANSPDQASQESAADITGADVKSFFISPPLNFAVWPQLLIRPHINVLLPSLRLRHMSGGPNTALLLAAQLADVGEWVRIIATDASMEGEYAALYPHMDALFQRPVNRERIALVDGFDRTFPIQIGANDIFLATAWWTAQMVKSAIAQTNYDKFIYLIQDFEPILHEGSTFQARALETYGLPHIPVINTRLLMDHLVKESCGCYEASSFVSEAIYFEPAIDRTHYFPSTKPTEGAAQKRHVLLFYARPTMARRNLYEIGLVALRQAVAAGVIDKDRWEVWAMGEKLEPVSLGNGVFLNPLPWMSFDAYAERVRTADLLLSLMLSPHPSYPPLEMAASGKFVVTNSFSVKTAERMQALSPNIIVAAPTPDSVAAALVNVIGRINAGLPSADPTGTIDLPSTWDESLGAIIPRLQERIALLRQTPAAQAKVMSDGYPARPLSDYEFFRKSRLAERRMDGRYVQEHGLLSFVTSAYDTDEIFLEELAVSVFQQDGGTDFEWFILDNGSEKEASRAALRTIAKHPCVRMERVEKNLGIIGGMRFCLDRATGRYIMPLDSDDIIEPDCVHVMTRAIQRGGYPAALFTDEDKLSDDRFSNPYFKPDWDPVLFVHSCYIAHLCAIDRVKALELDIYTNRAAEGCHDWDSFIRLMNAGHVPVHIPEVLYSWRMHRQSTSGNIASKSYIADSHRATLRQFLDHADAPHVELTTSPLFSYGVDWWFKRKRTAPLSHLSLVIDNGAEARLGAAPSGGEDFVFVNSTGGIAALSEQLGSSKADLVHIRWSGVEPDDDEWLWDSMALIELFPDTVMVGGTLHDGSKVLDGPRVFGFGAGFDCPDRDRPLADLGFSAQMWKPHSVSAIPCGHFVVRRVFLQAALAELMREQVPLNLLSTWLSALAREADKRVVFSPFMRALTKSNFVPEDAADSESKKHWLSRFWHLLPETGLLSLRLGLTTATAYTFVSDAERRQHLQTLSQHGTLSHADALALRIRRRSSDYPVPAKPVSISILTTVYEGANILLLEELATSVMAQSHRAIQWVIVAHGPILASTLEQLRKRSVEAWGATLIVESNPLGIMGAMLQSLKHAKGDYVVPIDADDLLTVDAIQILVHEIDRLKRPSLIYSDEDLLINGKPEAPYLKPDFDPILNLDSSYIWHLCAINRETAVKLALYTDTGANWCHDWDTVMRIWNAGGRIEHVAEILYHWRQHPQSTTNQSEGDPRSLQSVRHVLAQQILRTAKPERYTVEPWPHFRGMKELYIARNDDNLPEFIWIGDVQRDGSTRSFNGDEILVVTSGDVIVDTQAVYREVVRLMELHPKVAVVGGRVLNADNQIVESCLIATTSGALVARWDGREAGDPGSYALALKTQSVAAAGGSLAFFRLRALNTIGCVLPDASTALHLWVAETCEKIRQAGWQVAFSPLVSAHAMKAFAPHGRRIAKTVSVEENKLGINLRVTDNTPHFVGTFDPVKSALVANVGEGGYLSYGPYVPIRSGKYVAVFTITAEGPTGSGNYGHVDVNGFKNALPENPLGTAAIEAKDGEQVLAIPFTVQDDNTKFEFRVMVNGSGRVEYKGVRVTKIA